MPPVTHDDREPRLYTELASWWPLLSPPAALQPTLSDRSAAMLDVSRGINPDCEHVQGDMRTLDLGRQFDLVLIHDAIMYAADRDAARAALATAERHCRQGGAVFVLPDFVRETWAPGTATGGNDAADGRGLRYLEWTYDPDPSDDRVASEYAFLLREADGRVRAVHETHVVGMFARATWLDWLRGLGLEPAVRTDPWQREVFAGRKPG